MPFIKKIQLPNNVVIALWENTETVEELSLELQTNKLALEKLKSIDLPKRKEEFCITQLLIKEIYGNFLTVLKDENGKPYLEETLSISISHSDKYSAVMLTDNSLECGIDVEIIDPRMEQLHVKFMSDYELLYVPKEQANTYFTIVWCLKEAIYKWYAKKGLDFKKDMVIHPFTIDEKGSKVYFEFIKEKHKVTQIANYFMLDRHIVAFVAAKSFEELV